MSHKIRVEWLNGTVNEVSSKEELLALLASDPDAVWEVTVTPPLNSLHDVSRLRELPKEEQK
jgi:hypothetical protein